MPLRAAESLAFGWSGRRLVGTAGFEPTTP